MSFEKKSLINSMTATKKAIIASSPATPTVGSKVASKDFSKRLHKMGTNNFSKAGAKVSKAGAKVSKTGGALPGLTFSKAAK